MNKRIENLIAEAFFDKSLDVHSDKTYVMNDLMVKRFAELIVRECAEVALREDHEPSECILSHFGIDSRKQM